MTVKIILRATYCLTDSFNDDCAIECEEQWRVEEDSAMDVCDSVISGCNDINWLKANTSWKNYGDPMDSDPEDYEDYADFEDYSTETSVDHDQKKYIKIIYDSHDLCRLIYSKNLSADTISSIKERYAGRFEVLEPNCSDKPDASTYTIDPSP